METSPPSPSSIAAIRSAAAFQPWPFITYTKGAASYFNPTIREFIGNIVSDENQTAMDTCHAAVTYLQLTNLWNLGKNTNTALQALIAQPQSTFYEAITRLALNPNDETIDLNLRQRITFLLELAGYVKTKHLCELIHAVAHALIRSWEDDYAEYEQVLDNLTIMTQHQVFLAHNGKATHDAILVKNAHRSKTVKVCPGPTPMGHPPVRSRPDSRKPDRYNAPRAHQCRFLIQSVRNQTHRSGGRAAKHWERYF